MFSPLRCRIFIEGLVKVYFSLDQFLEKYLFMQNKPTDQKKKKKPKYAVNNCFKLLITSCILRGFLHTLSLIFTTDSTNGILTPILQVKKLRFRKVTEWMSQDLKASLSHANIQAISATMRHVAYSFLLKNYKNNTKSKDVHKRKTKLNPKIPPFARDILQH